VAIHCQRAAGMRIGRIVDGGILQEAVYVKLGRRWHWQLGDRSARPGHEGKAKQSQKSGGSGTYHIG